ncbi:GNAT family N-acetyltransferase [Blastococcus sp. CT_GayMR16]|uniref:GNAT family N-acetyltransferase n=1 Tax=Blastococcus sp. CT_GayMR16 TaxID=2559607 RepID=UPI0010736FB7|nr:GNAT family N-acetyltransferase [Blastococcus sp. CT_GayMR16]TFV83470.1 GNAT family N-acetyltransferase [Blastococcus sp. CT_GayMR16]
MASDVLLHLIEPAAWRAALDEGAVRPPSLDAVGFVHLSTPEQVHLPAERIYPGRRDLVLLVVDPARLTDPVRFEPGVPADPGGMQFPHLYGPLPTSAVVAVVPYRPPAPLALPAADDLLGRALLFTTSVPVRRAVGVGDVPGGVAVLDPDYVHSRDNNRLVLTSPVDADTVESAAEEVAGNAGWPHQAAALTFPGADGVAAELGRRGWQLEELVLMARSAAPTAGGERAEVVAEPEVHEFWTRSWRRDLPDRPDRERVIADLVGREQLNDRVVAVTNLVVREEGRVVASGQLRVDGATAAVESVLTDPEFQGRGHADAILARALDRAAAAGCDLVVLEAAGDDWPRHWYARRGFEVLGSVWWADRRA